MERNGGEVTWRFTKQSPALAQAGARSIRGVLEYLRTFLDERGPRPVVPLGHGDPSAFACFRTATDAEDAVIAAVRSGGLNHYASTIGLPEARRAIAEYLSHDLPYTLSPDDIFLTSGCTQAIEVIISVFAQTGANILVPRPGFPFYDARAAFHGLELRHYDLNPDKSWEVDLNSVEALADDNTVAMVIINPSNPCGNVFTYEHLAKVAEVARKLGILVIADEVYHHLAFGNNPFVPMGVFGEIVPVLSLSSMSKRWAVPGWRLGWISANDPKHVLKDTKVLDSITGYLMISTDPATFIQGAVPQIIKNTKEDFFAKIIDVLKEASEICYNKLRDIKCITCPHKPEGSMFVMVKLNLSLLNGIQDDVDFCGRLVKEESVFILPGKSLGMKNWLRITFAVEPELLKVGIERLKSFCERHERI